MHSTENGTKVHDDRAHAAYNTKTHTHTRAQATQSISVKQI